MSMQRIYIALFTVVIGIGFMFLFWTPEPAKRKQRRALPKVPVAKVEEPKIPDPVPAIEEAAVNTQVSDDVTRQLNADQTDLTFEQGYCEATADPLESQWLRDVRSAMTRPAIDAAELEGLSQRFDDVRNPLPRDLLAQSILLRQLNKAEEAQAISARLPGPAPSDLNRMVQVAKEHYRAGRFKEAITNLKTHQQWSLGEVLYLPFLARVELTAELSQDFARRSGDGYQIYSPQGSEGQDWGKWQEGVDAGLDELSDFIEGALPSPLTIVVFKDQSELLATTCGKNWAGGIYDGIIKLFLNEDGTLPSIQTVQHELVHASLARNYRNRAPMWFEEGLAELFEHRAKPVDPNFQTIVTNRVYVPMTTLSDGFHLLEAGEEANAAYRQSRILLLWLQQDNGPMSLGDALALLNAGPLSREAFTTRVLGSDFEMETYFKFIQKLAEAP